ncbi:hypothetical protein K3495_g7069 [Podosphaera aphanis]|nr:hypothetical protein K3495_g7069 [Podosphaera aphanis]
MAVFLGQAFCGLLFLGLPSLGHTLSPVESPAANGGLICSPSDSTDCYSRLFQPTEDFQNIREGQDIPQGLHVRMNIYTGEKEARLNIPTKEESEWDTAEVIHGVKAENSLVNVPQPEIQEQEQPVQRDPPMEPPKYDPVGKIPQPSPSDADEVGRFQNALIVLKTDGHLFDQALDDLFELSHDLYYGVELAKDVSAVKKLICLTLRLGSDEKPAIRNSREDKAAAILGSALQNNPTALEEIGAHKEAIMYPSCAKSEKRFDTFVSIFRNNLPDESATALKIKARVVNALMKDPSIRDSFLQDDVMELLLAIFLKRGEEFNIVRRKVSEILMDNFLDEALGAELEIWPTVIQSSPRACEAQDTRLNDGCWEHHIEAFAARVPKEQWPKDFLQALRNRRPREIPKSEL